MLLLLSVSMIGIFVKPVQAERFQDRGLYINSARGGDTTYYIISFRYVTPTPVGSIQLEFCTTPIPSLPCDVPAGQDVSAAVLAAQTGETGYSITTQTNNIIVLSRTATIPGSSLSTYRLNNVTNPDGTGSNAYFGEPPDEKTNFYVRLTSYASTDATGPLIDYGSVASTITPEQSIFTQVPPILIFCVAGTINDDECSDTNGNFVDFGELAPDQTFYTSSEIQASTNASFGYNIYVTGRTMTAGIHTIPALTTPTQSFQGVGQFGMNLATNTTPAPVGPGTNATIDPQYDIPDHFLFNDGDVIVSTTGLTHTRKFTASYIINVPADQDPGVYSTTITYTCLAGF
jgi:hypothetical protein